MKYQPVKERTFVLVKPDGVARGLTGEILSRFERKGLEIVAARMMVADDALASEHYQEHQGNDEYYEVMKKAILGGPVLAVVLEGEMAIAAARQLIGTANPFQSQVGTIRADFATKMGENLIHGADSKGAATREIGLWMSDIEPVIKAKAAPTMPVGVTAKQTWGPPKKKVTPITPTPPKWGAPSDDELYMWTPKFEQLDYQLGESLVNGYGHNPKIADQAHIAHIDLAAPAPSKLMKYDKYDKLTVDDPSVDLLDESKITDYNFKWSTATEPITIYDLDKAFALMGNNGVKQKVES